VIFIFKVEIFCCISKEKGEETCRRKTKKKMARFSRGSQQNGHMVVEVKSTTANTATTDWEEEPLLELQHNSEMRVEAEQSKVSSFMGELGSSAPLVYRASFPEDGKQPQDEDDDEDYAQ